MEICITKEDFNLIKSFYPEFRRAQGAQTNDFVIGWSELMPLVEKIATIRNVEIKLTPQYSEAGGCLKISIDIPDGVDKTTIFTMNNSLSIRAIFLSVVEFIKWYNSTQRTYLEQNGPKA